MATSSFIRKLSVTSDKTDEFIKEMTKKECDALPGDFKTNLISLSKNPGLKQKIKQVLDK